MYWHFFYYWHTVLIYYVSDQFKSLRGLFSSHGSSSLGPTLSPCPTPMEHALHHHRSNYNRLTMTRNTIIVLIIVYVESWNESVPFICVVNFIAIKPFLTLSCNNLLNVYRLVICLDLSVIYHYTVLLALNVIVFICMIMLSCIIIHSVHKKIPATAGFELAIVVWLYRVQLYSALDRSTTSIPNTDYSY